MRDFFIAEFFSALLLSLSLLILNSQCVNSAYNIYEEYWKSLSYCFIIYLFDIIYKNSLNAEETTFLHQLQARSAPPCPSNRIVPFCLVNFSNLAFSASIDKAFIGSYLYILCLCTYIHVCKGQRGQQWESPTCYLYLLCNSLCWCICKCLFKKSILYFIQLVACLTSNFQTEPFIMSNMEYQGSNGSSI